MKAIVISGSRNPEGQTANVLNAFVEGLESAGGEAEVVFLPQADLERCRQCDDDGWGLCRREGRCVIEDDFAGITEKLKSADAAVFATPVYFSDLSESLKTYLDRLRRTCMNDEGKRGIADKPAVGICVAGGGGGGAPRCSWVLDGVLSRCGFEAADVIPARRQNLGLKTKVANETGRRLAGRLKQDENA